MDWVEHGRAPATLPAATADGSRTRDLCAHPRVSRYRRHGDPAVASSYRCASR
nr:tannase/feruloyl esterase family alpha/beta hydrolase [Saccharothrix texasensis]